MLWRRIIIRIRLEQRWLAPAIVIALAAGAVAGPLIDIISDIMENVQLE
jgi:hypothetical protein